MKCDEVIRYLHSLLVSAKGGVRLHNLNADYKEMIGEHIPYRMLGYQSVEAFLRTIPNIKITNRNGEWYVEAVPTESTAHISSLIARQKTVSKKGRKTVKSYRNPTRQPYRMKTVNRPRSSVDSMQYPRGPFNMGKSDILNRPVKCTVYKPNSIPPLMEVPVQVPLPPKEKPRYMQSSPGSTPSSPSKRLKERQTNTALINSNQSVNKSKDNVQMKNKVNIEKPPMSVITQKPKTVQNDSETFKTKPNISERLKIPPLMSLPRPTTMYSNTSIHSPPSDILSPPSPAKLMAGNTPPPMFPNMKIGMSGNTVPKQIDEPDPRAELKMRAKILNLSEPVYKIVPTKIKNANQPAVFAKVKVGMHEYSSFPEEARCETDAQKLAAKLALHDLIEKYGLTPHMKTTTDKKLMRMRVVAIVYSHENGVFMHQIPVCYKQQHKESLPEDWLKIVDGDPAIMFEKGADNSTILRRYELQSGKVPDASLPKLDKIQLNPIGPAVPGQLQPPEEDVWLVCVTFVASTTDIWFRLVGENYSDKFDAMSSEMAEFYGKYDHSAKTIEEGSYYVVFEDDSWHRVQCIENNPAEGTATVLFIDLGDEDDYPHNKLYPLDRRFCSLPAQAMRGCLAGLEELSDCENIVNLMKDRLHYEVFYVEVINHNVDQEIPYATLVFYDTSGPDDLNINKLLFTEILEQATSTLDTIGVTEVFVSHVGRNGDVYVQIQSEGMRCLTKALNRLIHTGLDTEHLNRSTVDAIDTTQIYFVSIEQNWYRGKVVEIYPNNQVKMFLIDFGKTAVARKNNLLLLEKLSDILSKFPAQAVKVHLHNIDMSMFNRKMVDKLNELAPAGEPLLLKIVAQNKNSAPAVELFKRIQPSNMLVSINTTLVYEEEPARPNGDGNNNVKPRKRLDVSSTTTFHDNDKYVKSLKPPKISDRGCYFDVHVTMAAHPGNFTVQPYEDQRPLEAMMIQLQEVCHKYSGPHPTTDSVKEYKLYAGEHIDGHWYRVYVLNIINENMVSVYFCDFGDMSVLTLNKLQPLKSQFLELPYQAIKAKLVGIQPTNIDWSVEDCLRFQDLVVDRNFVSLIMELGPDDQSPAENVLGLKLIDVDTAEDIYIDQLLVNEGRAIFVPDI